MVCAQRVLITGGNSGIGFEAARQLLQLGHHVTIACRDANRAQKAVEALTPVANAAGASVDSALLDLASLASVRSGAAQLLQKHPRLDVLLCNAGVMPAAGYRARPQHTDDGYESTLQVNHLAHFLLVHLLLPALTASPAARVVVVSSELHRKATATTTVTTSTTPKGNGDGSTLPLAFPEWLTQLRCASGDVSSANADQSATAPSYDLPAMQLYSISKLYNLWFTYQLAACLPPHVTANAVTPGWVPGTALGRGAPGLARLVYQYLFPLLPFTVSVSEGARRVVGACVGQEEGIVRGRYFSRGALAQSSPESLDAAAAERLWALSEEAAGISGPYVPVAASQPGDAAVSETP